MVVPVPASAVIQRDDEQVASVQGLQDLLPVPPAGEFITKRAAHTVKNRCLNQELLNLIGLIAQDLFNKVVQDKPMTPGERLDEPGRIILFLNGERRQLQTGHPALSPLLERLHVSRTQAESHAFVEKLVDLFSNKSQVGSTYLVQLARGAQAGKRQSGIFSS